MYKLDLPIDLRESAAIQRRKIKEQQRQSRIFNARVRTIGVSLHFDFFTSLHFHTKILTFFLTNSPGTFTVMENPSNEG